MKTIVVDNGKSGGMNMNFLLKNKYKFVIFQTKDKSYVNLGNKYTIKKEFIEFVKKYDNHIIILACNTLSSCILDILLRNNFVFHNNFIIEPIYPMVLKIKEKKYKNILVLSTRLTKRLKCHKKLLSNLNVNYIDLSIIVGLIDKKKDYTSELDVLRNHKIYLNLDCIVLGCTHFNVAKKDIEKCAKEFGFSGEILDSNKITLEYIKKNNLLK